MKKQNGITLIALIITIVVLLILAVVTINSVKDGGIITHAQDAANKFENEQLEEELQLAITEMNMNIYANSSEYYFSADEGGPGLELYAKVLEDIESAGFEPEEKYIVESEDGTIRFLEPDDMDSTPIMKDEDTIIGLIIEVPVTYKGYETYVYYTAMLYADDDGNLTAGRISNYSLTNSLADSADE